MKRILFFLIAAVSANLVFAAANNYEELERKEKARLEKNRREQAKRDQDGKRIRKEAQENLRDLGKSREQLKKEGKISGNPKPGRMLDIKD